MSNSKSKPATVGGAGENAECGVIMPISATANHSEAHWKDVQLLLHRGIAQAGMIPSNVWAGEVADRISERIVGNVFAHEIVVADISDLNANVMLELGLRLASKKPTVVVCEQGGRIPFDIGDFRVVQYPPDLNILGMERFFGELGAQLRAKHEAFLQQRYEPFLGKVVVDVLTPETRQIGANELILDRLNELGGRLARIERTALGASKITRDSKAVGAYFRAPVSSEVDAIGILSEYFNDVRKLGVYAGNAYFEGTTYEPDATKVAIDAENDLALIGGARGIPAEAMKHIDVDRVFSATR